MSKRAVGIIRLTIPAKKATPSPPVGPALGQRGINLMGFCKDFNAKTQHFKDDVPVSATLDVFSDKTYKLNLRTPPATYFIKKAAGLSKGSSNPGKDRPAGRVGLKELYEVAKLQNAEHETSLIGLEATVRSLIGSCKSMGIQVMTRQEALTAAPLPVAEAAPVDAKGKKAAPGKKK